MGTSVSAFTWIFASVAQWLEHVQYLSAFSPARVAFWNGLLSIRKLGVVGSNPAAGAKISRINELNVVMLSA